MGLVGMERRQKFVITSLLQSFLQSQTGQLQKSSDSSSSNVIDAQRSQSQDKFLIVETNFKVYAYTSSDLYRALLRQFIRVECIFPNLVVGTLTRKSLQKAFQRGISSGQILSFLESHIHLTARLNKLVQQQNNMAMAQGSINDFGLKNRGLMASGDQKNIPIADLFGLSSSKLKKQKASNQETYSFIPPNVRQQVELWEKELKSLKTAPGLLIEFESQKEYGSFLEHAIKNKISIMKKIDQKMLVVVDVKNEKQAYDFIFK